MAKVDFHNLGKVGVIKDIPSHQLPPEVWTELRNLRCSKGNLEKFTGHTVAFRSAPENYNNTVLMLKFDGSDEATADTDLSLNEHTVTFAGDAQLDTSQKKFGVSSLLLDGTGDRITLPDHDDFNLGAEPFTIECWLRPASLPVAEAGVYGRYLTTGNQRGFALNIDSLGRMKFYWSIDGTSAVSFTSAAQPFLEAAGDFYHVEVGLDENGAYLFVNGYYVSGNINTNFQSAHFDSSSKFTIGGAHDADSSSYAGHIDNFRITKGVCLHSAHGATLGDQIFVPPTDTFQDITTAPGFLMNVPTPTASVWVFTGIDSIWTFDNGSFSDITQSGGYNSTEYTQWDGTILGGIPILNNEVDPPQMWPSLSGGTDAEDLDNWPADTTCKVIRAFGPFLIAMDITDTSGNYPHMFWWSHPAEIGDVPVTWDYTDTDFQAGRRELTDIDAGIILDGMMLKDMFIIYKQFSTHVVRFQGGQNVMKNDLLFATSGILARKCVCPIEKGTRHFVVTADDIIIHNGQAIDSVVEDRLRTYIFNNLSQENRAMAFCVNNPAKNEAWFVYPELGSSAPNKAFVYNYRDKTHYFRDWVGEYATSGFIQNTSSEEWDNLLGTWDANTNTWGAEGRRQLVSVSMDDNAFFQLDSSNSFNGEDIPFSATRDGLAIFGKDRGNQPKVSLTNRKLITRMWPKIQSPLPVNIEVGVREFLHGSLIWSDVQSFDPNSQMYLDFTVNGRIMAVRFSGEHSAEFTLEGYDLEIEILGEL